MLHDITRYPNTQNRASQIKEILIKLNFKDVLTNKKVLN